MKSSARKEKTLWNGLKNFFFEEQSPYGLALVRMFLAAAALILIAALLAILAPLLGAGDALSLGPAQVSDVLALIGASCAVAFLWAAWRAARLDPVTLVDPNV